MSLLIRSVRPDDYAALAEVGSAAFPGVPHSADELRDDDIETPPMKQRRWVAELDGRVVGTTSYFQIQSRYHPQKFWMDGFVHPEHQRRGIGAALLQEVLAAIGPFDPILLRTATREDVPHTFAFLGRRGFAEGKRTWRSWLELASFDFSRFSSAVPAGIEICTLAELQSQPGWEQSLVDLYNAVQTDIPDIDPAAVVPLDQFRQSQLENARFMPDLYHIARDGDRWVGMTSLWKAFQPGEIDTGVTGVLREYRGRGIALALKLRSLAAAGARGYQRVETQNASTNRPMLAINEMLGFVKEPAWIHMIRTF